PSDTHRRLPSTGAMSRWRIRAALTLVWTWPPSSRLGLSAISRKTGQPTRVGYPCRSAIDDRRQRRLDPRQLCRCCHAAQQPAEVWVLDARNDVLPAIGAQHAGLDLRRLCNAEGACDIANEILRVGCRLCLQYPVDGRHERNQIVYRPVTLGQRESRMFVMPLQFIEYDVLALILPVILEDVLE